MLGDISTIILLLSTALGCLWFIFSKNKVFYEKLENWLILISLIAFFCFASFIIGSEITASNFKNDSQYSLPSWYANAHEIGLVIFVGFFAFIHAVSYVFRQLHKEKSIEKSPPDIESNGGN